MSAIECRREQDVVDAITSGRWPDRSDEELGDHVARCAICGDVVEVARALQTDHERRWQDARVPAASLVWWRAEMRARAEATRTAARPIAVAEGVAAVCGVGFAYAVLGIASPISGSLGWLSGVMTFINVPTFGLPLALTLGVCVLLAPVVIYLALSDR